MEKHSPEVDAYLEKLTHERKFALEKVRSLIFKTIPKAKEVIRNKLPAYQVNENTFAYIASQKHYMSIYLDPEVLAAHGNALKNLNCGKSCIRFKSLEALPLDVIKTMLKESASK
jgi:uncharacterized protein YdhG (YjbR/CyaY superfamily)